MLSEDIRFIEGLNACINCGTCTAICPAAGFYDYNPKTIMNIVQSRDEEQLIELLKADSIWYCGECLSCKTRCPRNNTPGYVIQALRALSTELGYFVESEKGRQQLALKRMIGDDILKYGYCVHTDEINTEMFPEQGPVWNWLKKNIASLSEKFGTNYNKKGAGGMRIISDSSLQDLKKIFDETGATERFEKIERFSKQKASEMNLKSGEGKQNEYFKFIYDGNQKEK